MPRLAASDSLYLCISKDTASGSDLPDLQKKVDLVDLGQIRNKKKKKVIKEIEIKTENFDIDKLVPDNCDKDLEEQINSKEFSDQSKQFNFTQVRRNKCEKLQYLRKMINTLIYLLLSNMALLFGKN